MSDILIKNMEMPKSCFACFFCEINDHGNLVCDRTGKRCPSSKVRQDCPLVEVKSHGELIERDKILEYIEDHETLNIGTLYDVIQDAPIVLEAST